VNVLSISSLLAAVVILAIGVSVLLRDRTRRTYTSFAALTFMVAAWHLCTFIATATAAAGARVEPTVEWLALWPAATIPPVALRFFREFLAEPAIGGKRRPPRVTLAWTIAAYCALIYSAIVQPIHTKLWFQIPFGAYVYGGLYRCVLELYIQYRATPGQVARTRIRYLMIGGLVAITLALTDSLPRFGVAWPTIGNVLTILYLYFLSQTLFRYRLLDLNELLGKMVVLGTLVVLLWATYGLLLTMVGIDGEGMFLLNALAASFVILVLFEPIRSRLESFINNRWLVRKRQELRGRMGDLRRELGEAVDIPDMVRKILGAVEESGRLTHAAIYLIDSDGSGYDLVGHVGPRRPAHRLEAAERLPFIEHLRTGYVDRAALERELLALEDAEDKSGSEKWKQMEQTLDAMNVSLAVPMFGSGETEQGPWLLGVLGFDDERVPDPFDLDDIDVFRRLAGQAARTIESTQVLERIKERDRLAAVGEMAAGLAHEIRNPLGAIKGAAQLLVGPDGKPLEPSETTSEFLAIIVEEVNRLNKVVTQFLDYARPAKSDLADHTELDVNKVVGKTIQLLESDASAEGIEISVHYDELLPGVAGDPEQLRQVFLNLGLNALQAMPEGGRLEIITTRRRRSALGYGSFAEVRFRDTGVGIPRDKIRNLFIPFYTTKQRGTGLGLAISQRIVTRHGGAIEVRSNPGKGSTFSVFLPAIDPEVAAKVRRRDERDEDAGVITQKMELGFRGVE
jgi:signal transduction histidine kinase